MTGETAQQRRTRMRAQRDTELDMLNQLLELFWPEAKAGDREAARLVLDLLRQRIRLTGIEAAVPLSITTRGPMRPPPM